MSGAANPSTTAPGAAAAGTPPAGAAAPGRGVAGRTPVSPLVLPAFMFAHFAHHIGTGGLSPLLPLIRESFGLDYARSGLLLSAQGLALGFGQLPISALADRMSKRLLIGAGLLGVGLAGIAISLSTSFWQLIPLLVATGVLAATYHAPAASFLAEAFSAAARGRALGTHVIGGALAFSAAPAIAIGVVQLTGSWRTAFLALSVAPLVAGVMMLVLTYRAPERARGARGARAAGHAGHGGSAAGSGLAGEEQAHQMRALAALKAIGPLVGVALAEQLLTASMFAYIPLFMVDKHGVPQDRAGLFIALVTGVGIFAAPLGGALSDRFGRAPVLVAVTASVGPLILLLAHVPFGWPVFAVLLAYGLTMNTRLPVLESLFADAIPPQRRSTVLGLYYFIGQESAAATTPLVGRLIDVVGPVAAFTVLGVLGTVLSLGLAFNWRRLAAPRPAPA
jgi:MFS family permease